MVLQRGVESINVGGSDKLGRYYTKQDIGNLLVSHMNAVAPRGLVDLGSGGGTLSSAAPRRWAELSIVTVDVDAAVSAHLKAVLRANVGARHSHICADALLTYLPQLIRENISDIDAAVCNPPFIKPAWRKEFGEILEDVGLSSCVPPLGDVDAALLFLAQNLRTIDQDATLGIILPDTMMSSIRYRRFRQELLRRYIVEKVIKLPRRSFLGTDALASITIIKKGAPTGGTITLFKLDAESRIAPAIQVTVDQAIDRFDYDYHAQTNGQAVPKKRLTVLSDLPVDVRRGSIENAVAKAAGLPVFHTSDMHPQLLGRWCNIAELVSRFPWTTSLSIAQEGDILVARVGRNLQNKICGVLNGTAILTDCVYRIRLPKRYRNSVLAQLSSPEGRAWLSSRTYGVGAKQLTKTDLLSFPLSL